MDDPRSTSRRDFLTGKAALSSLPIRDIGDAENDEAEVLQPPASVAGGYLLKLTRQAMACEFQVFLNVGQYPDGPECAVTALDLVEQLEDQLTVYREHSEVSRLNQAAASGPVTVENRLFALLQQAVRLHRELDGAYDITSGPLTKTWGFYRRAGRIPTPEELDTARTCVGSDKLLFDVDTQTVQFVHAGMEINLGSIGKGYALDRCAELMLARGIRDFLWHGGNSSVLGYCTVDEQQPGWVVGLRNPLRPAERIGEFQLRNQALGTSGTVAQFFLYQGKRYGHILDPRTGCPAEGVLSATVLAPTAALADALSTAFFVAGVAGAAKYCQAHPEIGAAMVVPGEKSGGIRVERINLPDSAFTLY